MQTKLILDLTALRAGGEREITTLLTLATLLTHGGFTWEDGTKGPRNLDADAIVVNHPKFDSPNVLATYKKGTFNDALRKTVNAEADVTIFDAANHHEFDLFVTGVLYLSKLNAHKERAALEDEAFEDHLARPLGWSGKDTPDPVYTFEREGVKVSVCKHVALMTSPKSSPTPSPEMTERLVAEAQQVARDKFGLRV